MVATKKFTLKIGAVIPSNAMGAIVVDFRKSAGASGGNVVLCRLPHNTQTPYVTWRIDEEGNCYWGHYAVDLTEAHKDYNERL